MVGDPLAWPAMNLVRLGGMMVWHSAEHTLHGMVRLINIYIYIHMKEPSSTISTTVSMMLCISLFEP